MAVSPATRRVVRERAVFRCDYCHADERWQYVRFTMDHVVPQSEQGSDEADNLVLACRNCNERRGNRSQALDPLSGETVALFNPRTDRWGDHFAWDPEKLRIMGISATGRATVALLDMNDDRQGAESQSPE
jgi:5-methylcytosine-specific restriction endonuclease McrA